MSVPISFGASILLNFALMVHREKGGALCTDQPSYQELMAHRFKRKLRKLVDRSGQASRRLSLKANALAVETLRFELPDLSRLSFEDICDLRQKLRPELEDFRSRMFQLCASIEAEPWGEAFEAEVLRVVETEVRPSIRALRRSVKSSRLRFLRRLLSEVKSIKASIPLVGTVFVGLPVEVGLLGSAAAVFSSATYDTWLENHLEENRSGLSFLLKLTTASS